MIKNGAKQGNSLSCIIFVLAMRNINKNVNIEPFKYEKLEITWPKCKGYADD